MIRVPKIGPSAEPVTLQEAKDQLRQNVDDDDKAIVRRIVAARQWAEALTGLAIPAQTFEQTFDSFPAGGCELRLGPPLISVEWIKYIDTAGVEQTWSAADYQVSTVREPGVVVPAYSKSWPSTRAQLDAVRVRFIAGWPCTSVAAGIASGSQTVTPGSMAGIRAGDVLAIDEGASREVLAVTAVAATTFTATFAKTHDAGARVTGVPEGITEGILLKIEESVTGDPVMAKAAENLLLSFWYGGYS